MNIPCKHDVREITKQKVPNVAEALNVSLKLLPKVNRVMTHDNIE